MARGVPARLAAALLLTAWLGAQPARAQTTPPADALPADPFQQAAPDTPPQAAPKPPAVQATPPAEPPAAAATPAPPAPEPPAAAPAATPPAPTPPPPQPDQTAQPAPAPAPAPAAPAPEPAAAPAPPAPAPATTAPPITVAAPTPAEPAPAPAPAAEPAPPPAQPVALDHPTVVDTATLEGGAQTLKLFGISGLSGASAEGLKGYIASAGDRLTCQPHDNGEYVCVMADGTDIALVALINGAAEARADAPDAYRDQQTQAQIARRGIWSSLPPPPTEVKHPALQDSTTLAADGQIFALDGVEGVGGDYARNMQGYIAANGDSLLCQPQGSDGFFVCLLADGTDVAKVALINGAARVTAEAPDAYRAQQADAMAHRRGIWADATPAELVLPPPVYVISPDEPPDGILYVDGTPTAVIDGVTVQFAFADDAGWGYYDSGHQWHGAPGRYAAHLDHYHPGGAGLRGYATRAATGHGAFAAAHVAPGHPIGTPPAVLHAAAQGAPGHVAPGQPGHVAPGQAPRPSVPSTAGHPIGANPAAAGHPVGANPAAAAHPVAPVAANHAAPARPMPAVQRPSVTPGPRPAVQAPARPAAPFVRPTAPAANRAPAAAPRPAPKTCNKGKC